MDQFAIQQSLELMDSTKPSNGRVKELEADAEADAAAAAAAPAAEDAEPVAGPSWMPDRPLASEAGPSTSTATAPPEQQQPVPPPPETEEDKANKRLMTLSTLFPSVDPEFLHQKGVEFGFEAGSEQALNQWIDANIDKGYKEFPTRSDYEKREKERELISKYQVRQFDGEDNVLFLCM